MLIRPRSQTLSGRVHEWARAEKAIAHLSLSNDTADGSHLRKSSQSLFINISDSEMLGAVYVTASEALQ